MDGSRSVEAQMSSRSAGFAAETADVCQIGRVAAVSARFGLRPVAVLCRAAPPATGVDDLPEPGLIAANMKDCRGVGHLRLTCL
jgi:hypothetical protein